MPSPTAGQIPFSLRAPRDLLDDFRAAARFRNESVSAALRRAMRAYALDAASEARTYPDMPSRLDPADVEAIAQRVAELLR